jgi:hypothetical protein
MWKGGDDPLAKDKLKGGRNERNFSCEKWGGKTLEYIDSIRGLSDDTKSLIVTTMEAAFVPSIASSVPAPLTSRQTICSDSEDSNHGDDE